MVGALIPNWEFIQHWYIDYAALGIVLGVLPGIAVGSIAARIHNWIVSRWIKKQIKEVEKVRRRIKK